MSIVEPTTTLGDLVTSNPNITITLDRIGFDYCCGGARTIAEAADEAGLTLDDVLVILSNANTDPVAEDWATMAPNELVDHLLSTHHAYLHEALPRLTALADKVATVHGERHPELAAVARATHAIRADLEPHLMKEEQMLFPMIQQLATADSVPTFHCGSLANPIRVMLAEHDTTGQLLAEIRQLTDDYAVPDDGCASYQALYAGLAELEADTHRHVHKENNVLFPAVLATERELATR